MTGLLDLLFVYFGGVPSYGDIYSLLPPALFPVSSLFVSHH